MINFIKQLFKPCESRYEQLMKLKGYSENNIMGLSAGFKFEQQKAIELDLGDNDIVLLQSNKNLSEGQISFIKAQWDSIKDSPGNKFILLQDGMTFTVLHRDKA